MLHAGVWALAMISPPGQAQVLGGGANVARVIATRAQALAQAARHLPIAAAIPNFAPIAMAAGAGFAQVAANAPPFAAAFAAAPFGAAPLAHDPA